MNPLPCMSVLTQIYIFLGRARRCSDFSFLKLPSQGCLPTLATIPVWIGLYQALSNVANEMNAVLGRITSTSQELAHYHSGEEDGIYLAYSDFNQFLLGDSSCLKELNQWFAKQLDTVCAQKGPFRLVAEEGKSKCSWVNISNTYVRDLEKSHHQRVSELQRLVYLMQIRGIRMYQNDLKHM